MNRRGFLRDILRGLLVLPLVRLRNIFNEKSEPDVLDPDYVGYLYAPYIPLVARPLVLGRTLFNLDPECWFSSRSLTDEEIGEKK